MPRHPTKTIRLGDRDYEIFDHLLRYRVTTREVLQRLFFPGSDINAVTKVTSRLAKHEYLNRHELYGDRIYFTFGRRAARYLGISPKKTSGLGPIARAREYGALAYCCLSDVPRERLLVREIKDRHPQFLQKKITCNRYYLDNDGKQSRLAYIHIDHGGAPDYIVRACRGELQSRYVHKAYADLVDSDRFMIAIGTTLEKKVEMIEDALSRHKWPIRFRVEVVPDLIYLISSDF